MSLYIPSLPFAKIEGLKLLCVVSLISMAVVGILVCSYIVCHLVPGVHRVNRVPLQDLPPAPLSAFEMPGTRVHQKYPGLGMVCR